MELTHCEREVGVVDQNVDGGPLFLNCGQHRLHLILPSHVRFKDHASTAIRLNFLKNLLRRFLVLVIVDDDGGAGLRKALCRGRTDTSARPGYESDFPLERRASSLLRHGLKSSNGDGVFRRALFVLRSVVLEGEKLHLHVWRAVTVQDPVDSPRLAIKGLKSPTGQFAELMAREMFGRHDAMLEIVEAEIVNFDDTILDRFFVDRRSRYRIEQLDHDDVWIDLVNSLGPLANLRFIVFPKTVQISGDRRDVVLTQELDQLL